MPLSLTRDIVSPKWLVIGSTIALSAIAAALVAYLAVNGAFSTPQAAQALALAAIVYAVAAALLLPLLQS